jgi:hypothetical protein
VSFSAQDLSKKWLFVFLAGSFAIGLTYTFYSLIAKPVDTKIVLTSGISQENLPINDTRVFSEDIQRIYCYIDLRGPFGQRLYETLLVKWYYGQEQFASHYLTTSTNHASIIWIEPPAGKAFEPGKYRVELISPASLQLAETINFQIK